jgi:hypothetical protein
MDTQYKSCVICLDSPKDNDPLYLLACGCKTSWFHELCKNNWLSHQQSYILHCPTCRRFVPMKTNYSFHWKAGPEQTYLVNTLILYFGEVFFSISLQYSGVSYAFTIPLESTLILCLPFMFYTEKDIFFYLNHIRARSIFLCGYLLTSFLFFQKNLNANIIIIPSILQTILLLITHLQQQVPTRHINPLFPFAISREVILAAKCSALTTERDES